MEISEIKSASDITGPVAKLLRKRAKLAQDTFWSSVGLSQASGCLCERGKTHAISEPVRMLIYTIYVAGVSLDPNTPAGTEQLDRLAQLQAAAEKTRKPRKKVAPAAAD